jgi:hypothetical protein
LLSFRAAPERCLIAASNDHEAIAAWLASKKPAHGDADMSPTQRAYRREAERLLLWAILGRREALSSLSVEDAAAFRDFLRNPSANWCGPRLTSGGRRCGGRWRRPSRRWRCASRSSSCAACSPS